MAEQNKDSGRKFEINFGFVGLALVILVIGLFMPTCSGCACDASVAHHVGAWVDRQR